MHTVFEDVGRWIGDYDQNGVVIQQAIWLGDLPVGLLVKDGGVTRLFHIEADALGSPRTVVDPTRGARGTVVWRWDLAGEAFGNDKPNEDPDGDDVAFVFDMRFPGQQYDSASGLNYNYFRDYEASTGRYVESDPIGLNGGLTTYGYAENRPNISIDRLGLSPESGVGTFNTQSSCELCAPDKKRFDSKTQAARHILGGIYLLSRNKNIEVCGELCRDNQTGKIFIGDATTGTGTTCNPWGKGCPACSKSTAIWHTHGAPDGDYSEQFSTGRRSDVSTTNWGSQMTGDPNFMGFLGTPNGSLISYTANSRIGSINLGPLK